jgi:hypothetical protein
LPPDFFIAFSGYDEERFVVLMVAVGRMKKNLEVKGLWKIIG